MLWHLSQFVPNNYVNRDPRTWSPASSSSSSSSSSSLDYPRFCSLVALSFQQNVAVPLPVDPLHDWPVWNPTTCGRSENKTTKGTKQPHTARTPEAQLANVSPASLEKRARTRCNVSGWLPREKCNTVVVGLIVLQHVRSPTHWRKHINKRAKKK